MNLSIVSDTELQSEYIKRFTLERGHKIISSDDAIMQFQSLLVANADKEQFYCLFLSGNNSVISVERLFEGSISSSAVYPRDIVKRVLELNALAVIIGHNHPSGNLNPSQDDLNITKRIKNALELVDCHLHDHLIIGYGEKRHCIRNGHKEHNRNAGGRQNPMAQELDRFNANESDYRFSLQRRERMAPGSKRIFKSLLVDFQTGT